ncbi:sugar phosphate isomerase/epimerase family protein [Aspergillus stella-maris]|uniref:sugar phosphate isomerase/epimerase family protein n=1 Tax=Aspergillus stella-maris TaxID=1810926 RepID=UPI003CCD8332
MTLPNKIAIGTSCLGQSPTHDLDTKIRAAHAAGFQGLEIVYGDLERYSTSNSIPITSGAKQIRDLTESLGLSILSLAPFENFEGSKRPLEERLNVAKHWLDTARTLGATYLQIPSYYDVDSAAPFDEETIVSELQTLSDLASSTSPVISLAYEPLSWGVNYSTWDSAYRLVQLVNRDNFGLCMDTFHEVTKLWACSYLPSGIYDDGPENLTSSLSRFISTVPKEKIFYIQLSDAEKFDPPFSEKHEWYVEGEAPEFTWSKHARPYPLEREYGGYTPVVEIVRAWVRESGFGGWISMEIFDRRMRDAAYGVGTAAERGWRSWGAVQKGVVEGENTAKV